MGSNFSTPRLNGSTSRLSSGGSVVAVAFRVESTDGDVFEVEPGETVLAAALRAGIDIPYSCRGGTCRTCYSRVISGSIEHEPEYEHELMIDPDEVADGYRLLCSSLAHADSVIKIGG